MHDRAAKAITPAADGYIAWYGCAAPDRHHRQRRELCTFVVVGAGYTGTEVAAQGQLSTRAALRRHPRIRPDELRWLLVDQASAVLPELGPQLSRPALRILRRRGLDVRLETTIEEITGRWVRLSDGTTVPTRTVVWCVGVTPGPLTQALGLETVNGRIVVDEFLAGLAVAEQTDIYYRTDGRPLDHGRPHDHGRRGAASP
jgi:NADH dehydrogenase FAD-containing subunit